MHYFTKIAKTENIPVPFADFPKHVQEKIIAYGCQRVFNDMVGGNDRFADNAAKVAFVHAQIERFKAGDIGRARAAGVALETGIARQLVRAALKQRWGAKSPEWAAFTGLSDREQTEKLDALYEKNKVKFEPKVEEEIARRAVKHTATIDIDF